MATPTKLIDKALASAAAIPSSRKNSARVALINVKDSARIVLSECFRQFGIGTVLMTEHAAERLRKEKFEACVLKLDGDAETMMASARTSRSNSRMVIYGLGGSAQEAMRYSKYGINAVFHEPLERSAALKLVRATQMLVLHEFRRYVRIPVMTEVSIVPKSGRRFSATSLEVSSGGMSIKSTEDLGTGHTVEVSFALLTLPRIWVRGTVTWRKAKGLFGICFDPQDERRRRLKEWIDAYLEA